MKRLVAFAVSVATLAACSGGKSPRALAPTTTVSAGTTTTTGTTTTAAPCPSAPVRAPTVRTTDVSADVDGDGTADVVTVYGTGSTTAPGPWFVSVELGPNDRREAGISDAVPNDPAQNIRVLGVARLGGRPAVFVAVGTGAAATIVGLFQLVDCSFVRVVNTDGMPVTFTVGGTVTHLDGLRCNDGLGLTVLSARSPDGVTYSGATTEATVAAGQLTTSPPTTIAPIDPSAVDAFGHIDCPGVEPV